MTTVQDPEEPFVKIVGVWGKDNAKAAWPSVLVSVPGLVPVWPAFAPAAPMPWTHWLALEPHWLSRGCLVIRAGNASFLKDLFMRCFGSKYRSHLVGTFICI